MPHALADRTSIALHCEVAARIQLDDRVLVRARARVWGWGEEVHPFYRQAWTELLEAPIEDLCARLVEDSERMRDLRQCTPFAGALDPRTRWRIWREVRGR